ncbi:hypothetical protein QJS66_04395 [Kocuria rhizophila]|nr:hypothetical protein QJS66_04395 [Kocuria rhizophila]
MRTEEDLEPDLTPTYRSEFEMPTPALLPRSPSRHGIPTWAVSRVRLPVGAAAGSTPATCSPAPRRIRAGE